MFGITKSATEDRLEVIIGPGTTVEGDIRTEGFMRILGTVNGSLAAPRVAIGTSGRVRGNLDGRIVDVSGQVEGDISATESLQIRAEGRVRGNIHTANLVISPGAVFEGSSRMGPEPAAPPQLEQQTAPSEPEPALP